MRWTPRRERSGERRTNPPRMNASEDAAAPGGDFIHRAVAGDIAAGRVVGVVTRFPPEPNGYLHIGHAKSICLNFGVAAAFGGRCNLRFDDTNPAREDSAFARAIERDVRWLGFDRGERRTFASDYFETLYGYALALIERGLAYVDDQSADEIRAGRGTLTGPGTPSPWRDRGAAENLRLFRRMRAGDYAEGSRVLRARIDMASGNINLRDPVLYRILRRPHPRAGDRWPIYPTYDFAHGQCDALEGVTHSICTLEFEDHRPLYEWLIENLPVPARPRQYEFARLNLTRTVLSKRRLAALVESGHVSGWDDPRMPTLAGMRRRGFPPGAIREFCARIGVNKRDSLVDIRALEHCVREALNARAPRRMAVLRPLRLIVETFPEGETDWLDAPNHPQDPVAGARKIPFSREILIERGDFMEAPPRKFFRLAPGREVRLRYAYLVTCRAVERDSNGEISAVRCAHDPASRGGAAPDGRKVRGTIHWLSAPHARAAEMRLIDNLFSEDSPTPGSAPAPDSLVSLNAWVEPALAGAPPPGPVQCERLGYFVADPDSAPGRPVFNRTLGLRDAWAREQARKS